MLFEIEVFVASAFSLDPSHGRTQIEPDHPNTELDEMKTKTEDCHHHSNLNKRPRENSPEADQDYKKSRFLKHDNITGSDSSSVFRSNPHSHLSYARNSMKSKSKSISSRSASVDFNLPNFAPVDASSAAYAAKLARADRFRVAGNNLYYERNYIDAVHLYTRAIQAYPVNSPPYQPAHSGITTSLANRASAYMALKKFTPAVADMLQSLRSTHLPVWLSDSLRSTLGKRVLRLVKCHLALLQPMQANEVIEHLSKPTSPVFIDYAHSLHLEMLSLISRINILKETMKCIKTANVLSHWTMVNEANEARMGDGSAAHDIFGLRLTLPLHCFLARDHTRNRSQVVMNARPFVQNIDQAELAHDAQVIKFAETTLKHPSNEMGRLSSSQLIVCETLFYEQQQVNHNRSVQNYRCTLGHTFADLNHHLEHRPNLMIQYRTSVTTALSSQARSSNTPLTKKTAQQHHQNIMKADVTVFREVGQGCRTSSRSSNTWRNPRKWSPPPRETSSFLPEIAVPDSKGYYVTLGVSLTVTPSQLKRSYRALCRRLHPDKGGATNLFQQLQEAYDTLSDPSKKGIYDCTTP